MNDTDPAGITDGLAAASIAYAEAILSTQAEDLSAHMQSSREASAAAMAIYEAQLRGDVPYYVAQVASALIGHAQDLNWPDWRAGVPAPPAQTCDHCGAVQTRR